MSPTDRLARVMARRVPLVGLVWAAERGAPWGWDAAREAWCPRRPIECVPEAGLVALADILRREEERASEAAEDRAHRLKQLQAEADGDGAY